MIFVRVDIDLCIGQFQICDRIDRFYQLMCDLVAELCGGNPTLGGKLKIQYMTIMAGTKESGFKTSRNTVLINNQTYFII